MFPISNRKSLVDSLSWQKLSITILKWAIFAITFLYLYKKVWKEEKFEDILYLSQSLLSSPLKIALFATAFCLLFVNWGFEAAKWKLLIGKFKRISFKRSFLAILAGTSVSLWVPNRAGEYFGRIFFLPEGTRIKGIFATLVGSVSQLLVTILMGLAGLIYFLNEIVLMPLVMWIMVFLGLLLVCLIFFLYFNIGKLRYFVPRFKLLKPLKRYLLVYSQYSSEDLIRVFLFSFWRYLVFSFQYFLLLWFFGVAVPLLPAFLIISLIYLVQAAVPSNVLTELGIRGAAGVYFFKAYSDTSTALFAASYTLWLINLMLPALAGIVILLFVRLSQRKQVA